MQIDVKFSGASLDTFVAKVAALGAEAPVEMARGLNDGGDIVRTQVRRALKDQMGVTSYGIVVDHTGSIPASPSGLVYKITGSGKGLPIKDFPVSASPGGPVTAMPWGVSHTFTAVVQDHEGGPAAGAPRRVAPAGAVAARTEPGEGAGQGREPGDLRGRGARDRRADDHAAARAPDAIGRA